MRLIDADKLKERTIKRLSLDARPATVEEYIIFEEIDNAPTIIWCSQTPEGLPLMDLRERSKGEWIKKDNGFGKSIHICSKCGERALEKLVWIDTVEEVKSTFCPNCGADMGGENK